jgi:hypothetical protein
MKYLAIAAGVDYFLIRLHTNLARGVELRAYANPPISYLYASSGLM